MIFSLIREVILDLNLEVFNILGSYGHVGSVPEEGRGVVINLTTLSSSQKHGLHHSVSVDQHLSRRSREVDKYRLYNSITSNENQFPLDERADLANRI